MFEEEGEAALGYLGAEGVPALREQLAARGREHGYATDADEILVTSGGQQAIDLVARTVLAPGDVAVVESPTFIGGLNSLHATGARVIGIPVDGDGLDVDVLEKVLASNEVKLCALQTACQNPTGADLSPERRERLARLAVERNFFVMEDGVYSDVRFEGKPLPALRQEAPGHVIYVNSLSKTVGGGLRIGWIAARGPVLDRLATLKMESDFFTAALTQHIAARWLASGDYERHLQSWLPFYRERRDALLAALERHLAGEYRTEVPRGGHHLWVTLTRPLDERSLYSEALRHGVAFTPGRRAHRRATLADLAAAVLLAARPGAARRGRPAPGPGDTGAAPPNPPLARGARSAEPLEELAQRALLGLREAVEVEPAHPGEVGPARLARTARGRSR